MPDGNGAMALAMVALVLANLLMLRRHGARLLRALDGAASGPLWVTRPSLQPAVQEQERGVAPVRLRLVA